MNPDWLSLTTLVLWDRSVPGCGAPSRSITYPNHLLMSFRSRVWCPLPVYYLPQSSPDVVPFPGVAPPPGLLLTPIISWCRSVPGGGTPSQSITYHNHPLMLFHSQVWHPLPVYYLPQSYPDVVPFLGVAPLPVYYLPQSSPDVVPFPGVAPPPGLLLTPIIPWCRSIPRCGTPSRSITYPNHLLMSFRSWGWRPLPVYYLPQSSPDVVPFPGVAPPPGLLLTPIISWCRSVPGGGAPPSLLLTPIISWCRSVPGGGAPSRSITYHNHPLMSFRSQVWHPLPVYYSPQSYPDVVPFLGVAPLPVYYLPQSSPDVVPFPGVAPLPVYYLPQSSPDVVPFPGVAPPPGLLLTTIIPWCRSVPRCGAPSRTAGTWRLVSHVVPGTDGTLFAQVAVHGIQEVTRWANYDWLENLNSQFCFYFVFLNHWSFP